MDRLALRLLLHQQEGRLNHMYLCTGGAVTAGVGHAMETLREALTMPWQRDGRTATATEVRDDFLAVFVAMKGLRASAYKHFTKCTLPEEFIDKLLDADVDQFINEIRKALPSFDVLPGLVQIAVFDMAFNLGITKFKRFTKLRAAIDRRDWVAAASESKRGGISEARNKHTAGLFLAAANQGTK